MTPRFKIVDMSEWRRNAEQRRAAGRGSVPMTPQHLLEICDGYEAMYQRAMHAEGLSEQLNAALNELAELKAAKPAEPAAASSAPRKRGGK